MKKQRIVALLASAMMVVSALSGCGQQEVVNESTQQNENKESVQQSQATESSQEEVVNLYEEEVNLVYVLPQVQETVPGLEAVQDALNEITKEKINATIEFQLIPLNEYTDKMNMKFTAGEEFDLCFTGAWNPYLPAVTKGAYAELTEEVLNTYAPEYMAQLNPAAWDAVTVNGKIYGAPIEQIYVRNSGVYMDVELAKKYDYDYSSVSKLEDLTSYFLEVRENEKPEDVTPYWLDGDDWANFVGYWDYDPIVNNNVPGVVYASKDTPVVVNQFKSEEFKEYCQLLREWYEAGIVSEGSAIGDGYGLIQAASSNPAVKPGGDVTQSQAVGREVKSAQMGNAAMTTSAINATVTAVSATSENVERSVAFINLLNTDKEVLNLICHGIEGVDYTFVDEANGVIQSTGNYPGFYSFFIGCVFNEYYTDPTMIGTWEETAAINAAAKGSCLLGFVFDSEPVSAEISQCSAIAAEYLPPLTTGTVEPDAYLDEFLQKLDAAGAEKIITEMQSQIDAWVATK